VKKEEKDPLKSLIKAMKLDKNTGRKKNREVLKEKNVDGADFDEANGRPSWRRPTMRPSPPLAGRNDNTLVGVKLPTDRATPTPAPI
jgi:hypothetical protein